MAMTVLYTTSGKIVNLMDDTAGDEFCLDDIVRGLYHQKRFGVRNDTSDFTVLDHTLAGTYLATSLTEARSFFLHDQAEYLIGDLVNPIKHALRELAHATSRTSSDFDMLEMHVLGRIIRWYTQNLYATYVFEEPTTLDAELATYEATELGFPTTEGFRCKELPKFRYKQIGLVYNGILKMSFVAKSRLFVELAGDLFNKKDVQNDQ